MLTSGWRSASSLVTRPVGGGHGAHFLQAIFRELPPLCPIIGSDEGRHILDGVGGGRRWLGAEDGPKEGGKGEFLLCFGGGSRWNPCTKGLRLK